jgi:dipeptidase
VNQRALKVAAVIVAYLVGWVASAGACTSIMVGKKASTDGSVITSHTCDSHRTSSAVEVVAAAVHGDGAEITMTKRAEDNSGPMERYGREVVGTIPQVAGTLGYINPAYASMNEHQVAIGESTFTGREELISDTGLIDCESLTRLMLERARTAREAIEIGGDLLTTYGWIDEGEALTVADPNEVWLMEIVGLGKGRQGAVWAAQRIPDDHVSVVANCARLGEIDVEDSARFMASDNLVSFAVESGLYSPTSSEPFRFWQAYDPHGPYSFACARRIWRVLDLLAPSLELQPNQTLFPLSVKPDAAVGPERVMEIFRDTYEGTDYDPVKHLTVSDDEGKTVKSPLANPFMPYEMNKMLRINGGWGWRGERTVARWYCMYATVTQSRGWLPDPVGGVVWFGYSNPAMVTYVPLYAGITDLPVDFKTDGRSTGFSRESAWWAFNRVATLAAHRWGDMRADVAEVRDPLQERYLAAQSEVAQEATRLLEESPETARAYLTSVTRDACLKTTQAYWRLGDRLWTKYDEKW